MRYDYDGAADALYVTFRDEAPQRQVRLEDGTIIDVGASGLVVGAEVLVPSSTWDPDLVGERWSLDSEELGFLRAVAYSFQRPFQGCPVAHAGGGGKQISESFRLAA